MPQGEIWDLYFDSIKGSEQGGRGPDLIISGNLMKEHLGVVIICPLSTRIKGYKGNVVLEPDNINKLSKPSEIMLYHISSVSKERLKKKIGSVKMEVVEELKNSLADILRY
jgi:mRNA interferase MazF